VNLQSFETAVERERRSIGDNLVRIESLVPPKSLGEHLNEHEVATTKASQSRLFPKLSHSRSLNSSQFVSVDRVSTKKEAPTYSTLAKLSNKLVKASPILKTKVKGLRSKSNLKIKTYLGLPNSSEVIHFGK